MGVVEGKPNQQLVILRQRQRFVEFAKIVLTNVGQQGIVGKQADGIKPGLLRLAQVIGNEFGIIQTGLPHLPGPVKIAGVIHAQSKKRLAVGINQVTFIFSNSDKRHKCAST